VDWIGLAQDRNRWSALVNSVLNLRVPWNSGKLSSGLTSSGLSSSAQLHRVSHRLCLQPCTCTLLRFCWSNVISTRCVTVLFICRTDAPCLVVGNCQTPEQENIRRTKS
jgi:hypothetical protein